MRRALVALACLGGCASPQPSPLKPADFQVEAPWERAARSSAAGSAFYSASYYLTWEGQRIGEAREVFEKSAGGVRLTRRERVRVTRSGEPVESETEVVIDADPELRATRVDLRARAGATTRRGRAVRADDGSWVLSLDGEPVRRADKEAVPAELVPFLAARAARDRYRARVFLAGYGFAVADLRVQLHGRRARSVLETPWGNLETDQRLAGDGTLLRAASGSIGSQRVDPSRLDDSFVPPDLPERSAIPLSGRGRVLIVEGAGRRPPPPLFGQNVTVERRGWRVELPDRQPDPGPEVAAITRKVGRLLKGSLDAPGAGADAALSLGRGDCTAYASLFAELAEKRGLEVRLVTGYRIDDDRLARHRWAAVRRGGRWIPVDPTFGEAPAPPARHLALAMHGADTADIALVDEVVFHGLARAKAHWQAGEVAAAGRARKR